MAVQTIGLSDISALLTAKSVYLLAYSWLFGMCEYHRGSVALAPNQLLALWVSFFGGVIAYRALR